MSSNQLVIVESPAKAATIEKYLGKDFTVVASYGHIRDLPKSGMAIDVEKNFEPSYEISPDKKKRVAELRKLAKTATTVWLASDDDREGEAIAWHLAKVLGLDPDKAKRIVFHEITKTAILAAIEKPRTINEHLVDAQQARRVLDRLVGYELSPVLWKKVRPGLSAGRVQSVAVRVIVEREREILDFSAGSSFKVTGDFLVDGKSVSAELEKRLKDEPAAQSFLTDSTGATYKVDSVAKKPATKSPAPPFTTSTLQQEASRKLGFSVRQTMTIAQKLYEAGNITYMRTDSLNLSELAIGQAATVIKTQYGSEYVKTRHFKTKSAGAQEAHEAIRPTDFGRADVAGDRGAQRLYNLIRTRALASQMAEAKLERTEVRLVSDKRAEHFVAKGEVIIFDGFLKLYIEGSDNEDDETLAELLPNVKAGDAAVAEIIRAHQTYERPKPRYTEASLVKRLEEMGIGRPSTYAPTISTIQDRGYVEKGDREALQRTAVHLELIGTKIAKSEETENFGAERSKLFPTVTGEVVNDFLVKHFADVVDFNFTAEVENEFDRIEAGKTTWNAMIGEFYKPFHKTVEEAGGIERMDAIGARELGTDPKSGKPVIARLGRYGAMVQIGAAEDEEKPKFAALPPGDRLDSITLERALELFKLPRELGTTEAGETISTNVGRFGPYVKYGSVYVSIKPEDPFTITREKALEFIAEKQKADAEKYIKSFDGSPIQVLNGRFGPYITDGTKNAKIPKGTEPTSLTLEDCQKLIEAAPARPKFSRRKKTS
jgi:DNA topoisomerase-1